MEALDWGIVVAFIGILMLYAFKSSKHSSSVSDFLAANRCAGRYLIGAASGMASMGAVSVVALWERTMQVGYTGDFLWLFFIPIGMLLSLSGFVTYRFRESRSMTLSELFEKRYSKKLRVFCGIIMWISGVFNLAIFPGIGARFFMNFTNLPSHDVQLNLGPFGTSTQSLTVIAIMVILLSLALFFTFVGGQISIIVTDFLQSMFVLFVMIGVIIAILYHYNWDFMAEGLKHASKPGESKYNPFDIGGNKDFNYFFWVIMFFNCVYQLGSWQGNQGHNVSAENPHEQKMAAIIGTIRSSLIVFGLTMVPIACLAVMHHPDSTAFAAEIKQGLEISFPGNPQMQQEQHTSMFLSKLLPMGLLGGFAAAMLAFFISTHNTYMHSWGSIFIQDVIMPFRKTAPSPEQHKRWLKMSILMVAVLIFSFSVLVPPNDYIFMFQQITGAIFLAGSGSLIIGGLYWKKGTTAGAWAAMISGAIISLSCIILRAIWSDVDALKSINDTFPLNGIEGGFLATVVGIFLYVTVSLLTKPKQDDILDKILHRGIYDESGEKEKLIEKKQGKKVAWYWRMMVVDPDVYTLHDKVIAIWVFFNSIALTMLPKAVILALVIAGFMSDDMWLSWWGYTLYQSMVLLTITAIWTSIGGFIDLKRMFKNLKEKVHSDDDNGRVEN